MESLLLITQIFFVGIMGVYFFNSIRGQKEKKAALKSFAEEQEHKLDRLNHICLTEPLSERTRPSKMTDLVGQEEGVRALTAALCGKNPQHVLIYGPPGVGKTCAARLALELAKKSKNTPFLPTAKFVEMDATCMRFDERSIADPLLGSVHDPIYQGAGAFGPAGIPQPKPGAVTTAHGGVLFLDEIGELHPIQMNKLLKVMEDRRVYFESAYYAKEDKSIPSYIHNIFQNGMPADFRLIGATTRSPEEIPPAIRSRVIEVFFRPLYEDELEFIATNGAKNAGLPIETEAAKLVAHYSMNGREAINMIQLAAGMAETEGKKLITCRDIEWIIQSGRYAPRPDYRVEARPRVGVVNGLAVSGANMGMVMEIEATAVPTDREGRIRVTGFAEQEQMDGGARKLSRRSSAMGSIECVLTVLQKHFGLRLTGYDIHVSASGGRMVDGPSAGIAIAVCMYSAVTGCAIPGDVAFTGELSLSGKVKPVGGVRAKLEAAERSGMRFAYISKENAGEYRGEMEVRPVESLGQIVEELFGAWQATEELHA